MNEDTNGQNQKNDPLDCWIEQTLHDPVNDTSEKKQEASPSPGSSLPPTSPVHGHGKASSAETPFSANQSGGQVAPPSNHQPPLKTAQHPRQGNSHGHPGRKDQRQRSRFSSSKTSFLNKRAPQQPSSKFGTPYKNPPVSRSGTFSANKNADLFGGSSSQSQERSPVPGEETAKKKSLFSFFKRGHETESASHTVVPPEKFDFRQVASHFSTQTQKGGAKPHYRGKMRCVILGGLDEVGKNCMAVEYGPDIVIIDMGFQFPEEDMLGVDYVIPDMSYLEDKIDRIRGILITHGHLDHIGAIPYLLPKLNFPPIYGTKLTMGLVDKRLEEFGLERQAKRHVITAEDTIQLGNFTASFFRVNHSIPDAVGIVLKSPAGSIAHTGDFKFDFTPSGGQKPADFAKIAALSGQDIAALFIDSTNALKPGYTISEKKIGDSLENIIKSIEGRIVIASFASQIGRMQQIIDFAKKYHRTIFLSGRSLIDNIFMAQKLGYLTVPEGMIHDIRRVHKIPEQRALILTTGSQGESVSALTRMAMEEHPSIKIKKGDTVVLSSSPIPGNERAITTVTNKLSRLGARIISNQIMDVHTSGHAQQEDLKLMMTLVKAKNIVPVHGEYHMRFGNKEIAMSIGYDEKNTILVENGGIIEIENGEAKPIAETVETKYILVDGLGVGDIGAQVMMDRQTLAENGVLIVLIPADEKTGKLKGEVDIISRGFIYMKESEELVEAIKQIAKEAFQRVTEKRADAKRGDVKKYVKETIDKFVHQQIERHPLVLPVIVEK